MGVVVVLPPQYLFNQRIPRSNLINSPNFGSINSCRNPNSNSNPKPDPTFISNHKPTPISARSSNRSRKRSPLSRSGTTTTTAVAVNQKPRNALVMEQVKILKRGEVLDQTVKKAARTPIKEKCLKTKDLDDFVLASTDRLGPEPDMVPKQINVPGFYAGSAFIESPPPSSLPFPAFFKKRSVLAEKNDATSDLRRILGLDLV